METRITSTDGTSLATRTSGTGAPVVLVHGTTASKDTWALVAPHLESRHTVHVYDRRGRGESDDGDDHYGLEAEVDDLRAIVSACEAPPHVVAHSFGAVCALEAAADGANIASLCVYEPPVHLGQERDVVARTSAHLVAGDPGRALETFLTMAGASDDELAFLRAMPAVWDAVVAVAAATLERELAALSSFRWDHTRYADVAVPALILAGELTDAPVYATVSELRSALPHAVTHTFPGQRHVAMSFDPEGFAAVLLRFLAGD